jgi:hypothetical protein
MTAEDADEAMTIGQHMAGYAQFRDAHARAVAVYDRIIGDLQALPAGTPESAVHAIHFAQQDALCAAVRATQ